MGFLSKQGGATQAFSSQAHFEMLLILGYVTKSRPYKPQFQVPLPLGLGVHFWGAWRPRCQEFLHRARAKAMPKARIRAPQPMLCDLCVCLLSNPEFLDLHLLGLDHLARPLIKVGAGAGVSPKSSLGFLQGFGPKGMLFKANHGIPNPLEGTSSPHGKPTPAPIPGRPNSFQLLARFPRLAKPSIV